MAEVHGLPDVAPKVPGLRPCYLGARDLSLDLSPCGRSKEGPALSLDQRLLIGGSLTCSATRLDDLLRVLSEDAFVQPLFCSAADGFQAHKSLPGFNRS